MRKLTLLILNDAGVWFIWYTRNMTKQEALIQFTKICKKFVFTLNFSQSWFDRHIYQHKFDRNWAEFLVNFEGTKNKRCSISFLPISLSIDLCYQTLIFLRIIILTYSKMTLYFWRNFVIVGGSTFVCNNDFGRVGFSIQTTFLLTKVYVLFRKR